MAIYCCQRSFQTLHSDCCQGNSVGFVTVNGDAASSAVGTQRPVFVKEKDY